jgi:Cu+-exporting ATPase
MRTLTTIVALFLLFGAFGCSNSTTEPGQSAGAGQQAEAAKTTVVDPVCGMEIDPASAAGKSEYKGNTYYFCNEQCKKTFDADPEAVLNKGPKKM